MDTDDVDESLYSRQLYVMGHEAQKKMAKASILIMGLDGLGVETAKNVILAGVKSVSLFDNTPASYEDLASQFYLNESDIGKSRAEVSKPKLAELNPYVDVSILQCTTITPDILQSFTCVVLVSQPLSIQTSVTEYCHAKNIAVLVSDVKGVFARIFCDFGVDFVVHDVNGEPDVISMVAGVTKDSPALVTVLEETRHGLQTGDKVLLTDIGGMENLNGQEFTVTVKDAFSFEINTDTTGYPDYYRGGYCKLLKKPEILNFDSMNNSYENPGEFVCDFMKFAHGPILHLAFKALDKYKEEKGSLPNPGNTDDAQSFYDYVKSLNSAAPGDGKHFKLEESDISEYENLFKRLALCCRGVISPMCALVGGILGQEVLKACSGKFKPIKQWYYFDAIEALPETPLPVEEVTPVGCRYDGQIMVFGKTIQEKLMKLNTFLVGAGAIGCEMLKNWALMGIACDANSGTVYVTDMDHIERSNLSRQFLFRNKDIGSPKSTTAAAAMGNMNPSMRTVAFETKVAPETESHFNDDFFESLDIVCAALDNVEARLYLDQRCVFYRKPMLESGTLGTKGHTQIVVPGKTENYGATRDPPEKTIPLCTVKTFPNQIEHTLQWAREWFEEVFKQTPDDVNKYLTTPDFYSILSLQQNMKLETVRRMKDALVTSRPTSFEHCIAWARVSFEDLFVNKIKQLLYNFPEDKMTATGTPFWSGAKRAPSPLIFDINDSLHIEFIVATSNMLAELYRIPGANDMSIFNKVLPTVKVPSFNPSDGITIATTDEEAKAEAQKASSVPMDIDDQCKEIYNSLPSPTSLGPGFVLKTIEFDKDIDSQMRVIAACSNLRARNYKITEADLHTSRGIAGKITPAIATTTALVTGAICLEIYKLLQDKPVNQYMNSFNNLAIPLFTNMEPNPPKVTATTLKGEEWKWTLWDRIDINKPTLTLTQLLQYLEEEYGLEISMFSSGVTILYSSFMNKKKMDERKNMTMKQVVESITKKEIPTLQKYLIFEMIASDAESGDELELPYVRFALK